MSSKTSKFRRARRAASLAASLAALLLAMSACALPGRSGPQQIEVHAMLGAREVSGVGCMLANDSGRWTVVAPGRVTIQRSRTPLSVDCLRHGAGNLAEQAAVPAELARLDAHLLVGAQAGYAAGYAYPATLTVGLQAPAAASLASEANIPMF